MSTSNIIAALSKATKWKNNRIGVNQAKHIEKANISNDRLSSDEATSFRAMAARANYLALDRPDVAHATKELCRCVARPNGESMHALRHLVKYIIGRPG